MYVSESEMKGVIAIAGGAVIFFLYFILILFRFGIGSTCMVLFDSLVTVELLLY